jgi:hypothetical protein
MSGSTEKKPVQIRIEKKRKNRWKREAQEQTEYRSLTDLIVTSVENELREDPAVGAVNVDLDGVHDRLDGLRERVYEIEDTVDKTYMLVRTDEMDGYSGLRKRIQDIIPLGDRETILARTPEQPAGETPEEELEEVVKRTGSVSHLGRLLLNEGYKIIEIQGMVEQLADDVQVIEATYARPQETEDKRIYRVED